MERYAEQKLQKIFSSYEKLKNLLLNVKWSRKLPRDMKTFFLAHMEEILWISTCVDSRSDLIFHCYTVELALFCQGHYLLPRFTCFNNKILSIIVEESSFHKEFNLQVLQCDLEYMVQISPDGGTMLTIESFVGLKQLMKEILLLVTNC